MTQLSLSQNPSAKSMIFLCMLKKQNTFSWSALLNVIILLTRAGRKELFSPSTRTHITSLSEKKTLSDSTSKANEEIYSNNISQKEFSSASLFSMKTKRYYAIRLHSTKQSVQYPTRNLSENGKYGIPTAFCVVETIFLLIWNAYGIL